MSVVIVVDLRYGPDGRQLHILVEYQLVLARYFSHDVMNPLIVTALLRISNNGVADCDAIGISITVRHQRGLFDEGDWG